MYTTLKDLETIALSDDEIKHAVGKIPVRIMEYKELVGHHNLEELVHNFRALLILLEIDDDNTKAGHWITIIDRGEEYEYFDPYGLSPAKELAITHEAPVILNIIRNTKKRVLVNSHRFQKFKHDVNTCGRWCIVRIRHWPLSLRQFQHFTVNNSLHFDPDVFVTYLTMGATNDRFAPSPQRLEKLDDRSSNVHL